MLVPPKQHTLLWKLMPNGSSRTNTVSMLLGMLCMPPSCNMAQLTGQNLEDLSAGDMGATLFHHGFKRVEVVCYFVWKLGW